MIRNFLLAMEHCPVYTVGLRSSLYSKTEENKLKKLGADFHRTSRGGLITFHGPGQLVMYPIFDLKRIGMRPVGVRRYVELLEQIYKVVPTGVWINRNRKLAALGIAVSHGVTYHGLALNCNTDLTWYDHIVGCGIEGAEATSLSRECNRDVKVEEVMPKMVEKFTQVFGCQVKYPS
ncbi:lipoyl(octanoyl) transferase [Dictyocaulus viviparus]|uniref:lipoyl(octanoyl) transferase n=1 Tax=Dictyocaulus viviparus TaxID=29172 RepID=A0A0D8XFK8_DICVI|nr:lipoyl(octanoyl) transferase [Dictyocaulus viviparus]